MPLPSTTISFHGRSDMLAQLGMCDQRTVRAHAQKASVPGRDGQEAAVREPVDGKRKGCYFGHNFALAVHVDSNDLVGTPIGQPKAVFVPAG